MIIYAHCANRDFINIIKKEWLSILFLILSNILISFLSVYPTFVIGLVVDNLLNDKVFKYILLFIILRILFILFKLIAAYLKARVRSDIISETRIYAMKLAAYNPKFGDIENTQYLTRINDASEAFENSLSSLISWISISFPTVILTILCMVSINATITVVLSCCHY